MKKPLADWKKLIFPFSRSALMVTMPAPSYSYMFCAGNFSDRRKKQKRCARSHKTGCRTWRIGVPRTSTHWMGLKTTPSCDSWWKSFLTETSLPSPPCLQGFYMSMLQTLATPNFSWPMVEANHTSIQHHGPPNGPVCRLRTFFFGERPTTGWTDNVNLGKVVRAANTSRSSLFDM